MDMRVLANLRYIAMMRKRGHLAGCRLERGSVVAALFGSLVFLSACDQPQNTLPAAYPDSSVVQPEERTEAKADGSGGETNPGTPGASAGRSHTDSPATANRPSREPNYTTAGMVGQVNGNPLYAKTILKPVDEQLAALARRVDRGTFRKRATNIIAQRLRGMVVDALILGEAERDLTPRQRQGLKRLVDRHRKELMREYGQGSEALAKANLKEQTGDTLGQTLEDYRRRRVITRFLARTIRPKINVTRRDIQRYYREHADQYNPPTKRRLRLIRVNDKSQARSLRRRLEHGEPFEQVARSELNTNLPSTGGLMTNVQGSKPLRFAPLNQAIRHLDAGQWAGPIQADDYQWFVQVEKIDQSQSTAIMDVQLKIEKRLQNRRYRELSADYKRKLMEHSSHNSIREMTDTVVEIAVNRYAVSQPESS